MPTFANWVGNQRCTPARRVSPASEPEVQDVVREAVAGGQSVRVVATGHSFSPVHLTEGTLIDLANLGGIVHIDAAARRVRALYELEYFLPYEHGAEAMAAMRELMLACLPDSIFPMEVRTVAADESWLSHSHGRASVVISVSGVPGTDYEPYLREVDRLLGEFDARVHWGKLHFLTAEQLHARYPRAADFIALRHELDPRGVFLNDHLRPLFA